VGIGREPDPELNRSEIRGMSTPQRIPRLNELRIKIFSDGADLDSIIDAHQKGLVKGFTTNPTLMAKAGITNYMTFAREVLRVVTDLPVSFEVFSDEFDEMREQAHKLAELAPMCTSRSRSRTRAASRPCPLIHELAEEGIRLNITAILSLRQVREVVDALQPDVSAFVSVFAGRIADTGIDPLPIMKESLQILKPKPAPSCCGPAPANR
jgi:transaldolase